MTEQTEHSGQTATLPPEGPPADPPAESSPPRVRRALGVPVVAAVAMATLLIGGLVGGIIGYAVHADGPDRQGPPGQRFQQGVPGQGPQGGPDGTTRQPPQQQ